MSYQEWEKYYELKRKEYIIEQRKELEKILILCSIGMIWFIAVIIDSIPLSLLSLIITYFVFIKGENH
jgi:hypothetical protein